MPSTDLAAPPIRTLLDRAGSIVRRGVAALPPRVVTKALTVICDDLAAMVAAGDEDEVRRVNALAAARGAGSDGGATVIGIPAARTEPEWAAMANAVAANWLELDGGYRLATCHGSLYTLPSALAELERRGGTVGDLVVAIVTAYEVVTRIARAYRPPLPLAAHPHATLSPVGAGAAVAAARKLDGERYADTVFAAATMSLNGPFSHAQQGATVRNAWAGAGARLGFLAADLAAAGLSGSATAVSDVFGTSYGYPEDTDFLTADLGAGERFAIEDAYHKLYACCQYLHASVEAASLLAASEFPGLPREEIAGIDVLTHALACALDSAEPATVLAGKFSLPHAVAAVLARGSVEPEVFSQRFLHDPVVASLRSLARITEWVSAPDPPHDRPATVTVTLRNGEVREQTVLSAVGGPDRPLTEHQLLSKIKSMTEAAHPGFAAAATTWIDPAGNVDLDLPVRDFVASLLDAGRR